MPICPQCQRECAGGKKFCAQCGAPLADDAPPAPPEQPEPSGPVAPGPLGGETPVEPGSQAAAHEDVRPPMGAGPLTAESVRTGEPAPPPERRSRLGCFVRAVVVVLLLPVLAFAALQGWCWLLADRYDLELRQVSDGFDLEETFSNIGMLNSLKTSPDKIFGAARRFTRRFDNRTFPQVQRPFVTPQFRRFGIGGQVEQTLESDRLPVGLLLLGGVLYRDESPTLGVEPVTGRISLDMPGVPDKAVFHSPVFEQHGGHWRLAGMQVTRKDDARAVELAEAWLAEARHTFTPQTGGIAERRAIRLPVSFFAPTVQFHHGPGNGVRKTAKEMVGVLNSMVDGETPVRPLNVLDAKMIDGKTAVFLLPWFDDEKSEAGFAWFRMVHPDSLPASLIPASGWGVTHGMVYTPEHVAAWP